MKTKKENKNESLSSLIGKLKDITLNKDCDVLAESQEDQMVIYKKIDEWISGSKKQDKFSALFAIGIILLLFGSIFMISLYDEEVYNLKNDVNDKMYVIQRLQKSDSLFNIYMDVDSSGRYSYMVKNGMPKTYPDLTNEIDSITAMYYRLKNEMNDSLWAKNAIIKLLQEKIPFSYKIKKGKEGVEGVSIESSIIDSAMIYYRYGKENLEIGWFADGPLVRIKEKK